MTDEDRSNGSGMEARATWRGVDFSGLTVVLGVGTGRLIRLLNEQAQEAGGTFLVVSFALAQLKELSALRTEGPLTLLCGRPRQIPVLGETVDLLVVNGVLREVPESKLEVMFEELWRVLVPGGRIRISDVIEPAEDKPTTVAWAERNRIARKLSKALGQPTALSVNVHRAAIAIRTVGFENLAFTMLPGYLLTDAWLDETVGAIHTMAGRLADRTLRDEILQADLKHLTEAYRRGNQRAAERFVLQGTKVGDLALTMGDDLLPPEEGL